MAVTPQYANSSNQLAALKELVTDDKDYMKNIVYAKNPWLALSPKNESPDGLIQASPSRDVYIRCRKIHPGALT